ncbi:MULTISPECIES: UvrD-helicase domain-containing protein [Serratia]|uniref:UvrD-helicase domain-containing protein n=3 Tax=Serratia TaxID=613 RepID=UPI0006CB002A|nr:ATP-dependent helicase [Serratia marcescens]ALE97419.1 ATP-dependent DNA helicase Rep [Serratia marcescens]CVC58399.1 DNA-dependent helicase II [Serratia marcescens]HBH6978218.1 ATP-dependent helicase [Serratia marcescens]HEJ7031348.1 ATP-dependent helicase [Serratia marcescens]
MYEIDKNKAKKEEEIIERIYSLINKKESFYFQSGAGSGKTYALVKAIKHSGKLDLIKDNHGFRKILCITYTNNATSEIVERLPNSDLYYISTIHYFIWELLKNYNKELIDVHVSFLESEIINIEDAIFHNPDSKPSYKKFRDITITDLEFAIEKIYIDKTNYYEVAFGPAKEYWNYLESIMGTTTLQRIKSNKQDVCDVIKLLMNIRNYKFCLESIQNGHLEYKKIIYNSNQNIEILHRNIIGHDTLLKYAKMLLLKNRGLSKLVIDSYPYIFIDECQDTNPDIIDFFAEIYDYSKQSEDDFVLGFFGDPMQTIFSKEIVHAPFYSRLNVINKDFNRRSYDEIINSINIIRGNHQPIIQTSIFKNKKGGLVKFQRLDELYNEKSLIREIIAEHVREWNISSESSFACLVLKNKMLASLCDYEKVYSLVARLYQAENSSYHNKVNEEFVVREIKKAGRLAITLHKILLPLFFIVKDDRLSLNEVFPVIPKGQYNLNEVREAISFFKSVSNCSLLEYIDNIRNKLNSTYPREIKELIGCNFPTELVNADSSLEATILGLSGFKRVSECSPILSELLQVNTNEFLNWMNYLHGEKKTSGTNYLTCHSSKGLEFDNVLILLEDSMLHDKNIFSELLSSDLNITLNDKLERARRIFYVSVSRAIKNVSIVLFSKNAVDFQT